MKKGTEYIGVVESIDFPNKGIVSVDGERAIVKNTVPGQKVRFVVNKVRKGKSEGRLLEVIENSVLETQEAPCAHFGVCGGCTYQTIPYETQLEIKEGQVKKLLDDVIKSEYHFMGIKGSPETLGYRNKMEFSFGDEIKDGPLALGLHKKGSFYDIVTAEQCKIVNEDYNKILTCVLAVCQNYHLSFYHKLTHVGYLRHLLVRRAAKTGEILINLVTSSQTNFKAFEEKVENKVDNIVEGNIFKNVEKYVGDKGTLTDTYVDPRKVSIDFTEEEFLKELQNNLLSLNLEGKIVGFLHTINDSLADIIQSDHLNILYGQDFFYEEILGLKFKISTFSFFQTNSLGAEVLYSTAREFVGETKDKLIFDLYSGTGTIAQLLAPVAKKVIGVEIVEEAVIAARENAALNQLSNCEFIAGDVLKMIDTIEERPDLIVLDPPRDGIHPKALAKIIAYGVDKIVYISCKPTSLARDLVEFQEQGYKVEKVVCVDMFPGTVHVETVILMTRCGKNDK